MIVFFISLIVIVTIFVILFPEYAWYIVLLGLAFEGLTFGVIIFIQKKLNL